MAEEQLYVEPSHRLPDEDWAKVVRRAKEIREEIRAEAQGGAASGIAPVVDMTALGIASKKYFPVSGIPTQLLVLHSGETPLAGGYAKSLTEWAGSVYPNPPIASWTWFVDPLQIIYFIPAHLGAWHASEANNLSEGFEQSGYARYTREQWLTADGQTQLESLAWLMAQRALFNGIPARWLTNAEVTRATSGDRTVKGLCLHRQIDPETRTDPGDGYPYDVLLDRIRFYMAGGTITTSSTTTTEDDMSAADVQAIKDHMNALVYGGATWKGEKRYPLYDVEAETQRRVSVMNVALQGQIAGLQNAIAQLAATPASPVDLTAVAAAAEEGAQRAVSKMRLTTEGGA